MKWQNLKENKCPNCGKDWAFDVVEADGMLTHGCGFRIRERRYKEIVTSQVNQEIDNV